MSSDANLIEIDLLRSGCDYCLFLSCGAVENFKCNYLVVVNRSALRQGEWMDYTLYPVKVREPLPCIAVPLTGQDPDALLDLQVAPAALIRAALICVSSTTWLSPNRPCKPKTPTGPTNSARSRAALEILDRSRLP